MRELYSDTYIPKITERLSFPCPLLYTNKHSFRYEIFVFACSLLIRNSVPICCAYPLSSCLLGYSLVFLYVHPPMPKRMSTLLTLLQKVTILTIFLMLRLRSPRRLTTTLTTRPMRRNLLRLSL